jgi:hypothetical protein
MLSIDLKGVYRFLVDVDPREISVVTIAAKQHFFETVLLDIELFLCCFS